MDEVTEETVAFAALILFEIYPLAAVQAVFVADDTADQAELVADFTDDQAAEAVDLIVEVTDETTCFAPLIFSEI